MPRKLGSKNKVKKGILKSDNFSKDMKKLGKLAEEIKANNVPRVIAKKPVASRTEPMQAPVEAVKIVKPLPVIDGYQITKVFREDDERHTDKQLLCEAVSKFGDKITIHVNRDYF